MNVMEISIIVSYINFAVQIEVHFLEIKRDPKEIKRNHYVLGYKELFLWMEKRFGITMLLMPKAYLVLYLLDKFPIEKTKDTKDNID